LMLITTRAVLYARQSLLVGKERIFFDVTQSV